MAAVTSVVTAPTASPSMADDPHHSSVNVGAIVAGVVCGVVGLVLVIVAAFWYIRRRRGSVNGSVRGAKLGASFVYLHDFTLLIDRPAQ